MTHIKCRNGTCLDCCTCKIDQVQKICFIFCDHVVVLPRSQEFVLGGPDNGTEIEMPKASMGRECRGPPPQPTRSGEADGRELPQRGPGWSPSRKWGFGAFDIFATHISSLGAWPPSGYAYVVNHLINAHLRVISFEFMSK